MQRVAIPALSCFSNTLNGMYRPARWEVRCKRKYGHANANRSTQQQPEPSAAHFSVMWIPGAALLSRLSPAVLSKSRRKSLKNLRTSVSELIIKFYCGDKTPVLLSNLQLLNVHLTQRDSEGCVGWDLFPQVYWKKWNMNCGNQCVCHNSTERVNMSAFCLLI